jgi:predicted PurR-regulated permease PerM
MRYKDLDNSTKIVLKVFGILLGLLFLWLIRDIVITLILGVILASAMDPLVSYFKVRRVPRAVSVLTVYIIVLAIVSLIVYLIIPPLLTQIRLVGVNLPSYLDTLRDRFPEFTWLINNLDLSDIGRQLINSDSGDHTVFSRTIGLFNGLFSVITVLVVSFYLVAEERGMREFIRTLVPPHHQDFTMNLVDKIQKKMGLWIIGQIILSLAIFALTFVGLTLLGVKYALFLALLAGLLEVVPYIGPIVSAIPAVFFAFFQSPPLAFAVLILYIIVQKTEGYVLVPKIMQKTVGTSPLVVLIALLVGFKLAGILGLLIAVPLAGAIMVAIQEFYGYQNQQKSAD